MVGRWQPLRVLFAVASALAGGSASCGLQLAGTKPATDGYDASEMDSALTDATAVDDVTDGNAEVATDACAAACGPSLALGVTHSCLVMQDGAIACWGSNRVGELGFGTTDGGAVIPALMPAPSNVLGLPPALQVSAGGLSNASATDGVSPFTCARTGIASIACWGDDETGALGRGAGIGSPDMLPHPSPFGVSQGNRVQQVTAGGSHACALMDDGGVECWGYNAYGELGRLTMANVDPAPSVVSPSLPLPATLLAAAGQHTCALLADGTVACWGQNNLQQLSRYISGSATPVADRVDGLMSVKALAARDSNTCALHADGSVVCWGFNGDGELGRGIATSSERAGPVALPAGVVAQAVCVGSFHACILSTNGDVWCWGWNAYGQLGTGTNDDAGAITPQYSSLPVRANDITRAVEVSCGGFHTCARLDNGGTWCWGSNSFGQLGRGTLEAGSCTSCEQPAAVHF